MNIYMYILICKQRKCMNDNKFDFVFTSNDRFKLTIQPSR